MWIFGYGSLMWKLDDLERYVKQRKKATLNRFHRDFNKSSTTNWGSKDNPGPTLGLEGGGSCIGVAYECNDNDENEILSILQLREGSHFEFPKKKILVEDVGEVEAYYPHNLRDSSYIGNLPVKERVKMCLKSEGKSGRCVDYVKNTLIKIRELQINDKYIEDFWKKIEKAKKWVTLQKTYYLSKKEFKNQLDVFFDFLKKIQFLMIFITLFIALCAILVRKKITQDVEIPAYFSLNLILIFLLWAYVFLAIYWWIGDESRYRNNVLIPVFLAVFGGVQVSVSLWFFMYYSKQIISPYIQEIIIYFPIFFFGLFFIINYLRTTCRLVKIL